MQRRVPVFFWLYIPAILIIIQIGIEIFVPKALLPALHSESGPHETLQAILAFTSCLFAAFLLFFVNWKTQKWVGYAVIVAMLGSFYIAGEEISWGQHILNWSTPEYWAHFNDQSETNLHNTSAWLDQKPRLLLLIGIIVGGLLIPFLRLKKPHLLPAAFVPLYPSSLVVPTALGVVLPYFVQEVFEGLYGRGPFERISEVQEVYMYYFVLIYLWDLQNREL